MAGCGSNCHLDPLSEGCDSCFVICRAVPQSIPTLAGAGVLSFLCLGTSVTPYRVTALLLKPS